MSANLVAGSREWLILFDKVTTRPKKLACPWSHPSWRSIFSRSENRARGGHQPEPALHRRSAFWIARQHDHQNNHEQNNDDSAKGRPMGMVMIKVPKVHFGQLSQYSKNHSEQGPLPSVAAAPESEQF